MRNNVELASRRPRVVDVSGVAGVTAAETWYAPGRRGSLVIM